MEVIIRSGIIVTGLLFIRKLAMGKISRKLQYYMWGILPIVLLIFPYFRIPAPALKENASQIRKAAQGRLAMRIRIPWEKYFGKVPFSRTIRETTANQRNTMIYMRG